MYSRDTDVELVHDDVILVSAREDLLLIHYTMEEVDVVKTFIISQKTQTTSHLVLFAVTY